MFDSTVPSDSTVLSDSTVPPASIPRSALISELNPKIDFRAQIWITDRIFYGLLQISKTNTSEAILIKRAGMEKGYEMLRTKMIEANVTIQQVMDIFVACNDKETAEIIEQYHPEP
jgi:hypothetical protein